ncbi:hypothetical protein ST47_g2597 [Ascochyta rabiei]|uniref:Uncharacterized protein n=1 Tax=Didymella rabiei TaxID=5454 RepID=A0A163JD88_DIDRA|nr:hypothetical protein ST47_g2597 [Ascochyta rabiei]
MLQSIRHLFRRCALSSPAAELHTSTTTTASSPPGAVQAQPKWAAKGGRPSAQSRTLRPENCTVQRQGLTGDPQAAGTPLSAAQQWPDHARVESRGGLPDEAVLPKQKAPCRPIMDLVSAVS